mgnify:CR=1 FL=1
MSVVPQALTHALNILGRPVGNDQTIRHRCLIVAELGINHCGSADRAKRMIEAAHAAGVDVVKLQRRDLAATYTPAAFADPNRAAHGLAHYLPLLKATQMADEAYEALKLFAEERGLGFLVTPWDEPSVDFLEQLGVGAYKMASADFANPFLARKIAATGKPLIASTGMQEELVIFQVLPELKRLFPARLVLMHAVSSYPTAFRDCQLHMILRLKINHGIPVGWSGHERGAAVSVAAAALGADVLERHFTLDRTLPGPDQAASLEPDGLRKLVERVRAMEEAYGDPFAEKHRTRGELQTQEILGKSLCFRRAMAAGHVLTLGDFEARSPGRGVPPMRVGEFVGRSLCHDVEEGAPVDEISLAPKSEAARV